MLLTFTRHLGEGGDGRKQLHKVTVTGHGRRRGNDGNDGLMAIKDLVAMFY